MNDEALIQGPERDPADEAALANALTQFNAGLGALADEVARHIAGQKPVIQAVISALLAGGHVLLEGPPGLGKTLLGRTLAGATGLSFDRVQCTPDLMPADVTGTNVLVPDANGHQQLVFRPGPIFAQIVLVDEINRAVPRTQSAMLEGMQEGTVTIGTRTHQLPEPFLVLATQNPHGDEGTYRLPEAQRDRFMVQVRVEQPPAGVLAQVIDRTTGGEGSTARVTRRLADDFIPKASSLASQVYVAGHLQRWVADLIVACDRSSKAPLAPVADMLELCPGPRAGQAMLAMARVQALAQGRTAIGRRHLKAVAEACLCHRMQCSPEALVRGLDERMLVRQLLEGVSVPEPQVQA